MKRQLLTSSVLVLLAGCGGGSGTSGTFELEKDAAAVYTSAYIAVVVADPPGDDLATGAGEHVVVRNNAAIRIDMGGWWIEAGEERLPLGIGRQIDVGAELRVHSGPGGTGEQAVFAGLVREALDDEGGVVVLRDAVGAEVARFAYGDAER